MLVNSSWFRHFFRIDEFSLFVGGFVVFFFVISLIYSLGFAPPVIGRAARGKAKTGFGLDYYLLMLLTAIVSLGAIFANHLVVFIACWGFLALLLYFLIGYGTKARTPQTAMKALLIVGGTDALMLLGLAIVWRLTGTFMMNQIYIPMNSGIALLAYLCFAAGAFAKAGAMPFHTWIPDTAEDAPTPVTAFLPASLDKLIGIYFLARASLDLFQMNAVMSTFLMACGAFTIVAAVMMALVQHDLKRLLGYHAVSQVGYMIMGIGTGTPVGVAGGLFHMLNNAIYKSCLFLSGGSVEKKTGTTDLGQLGGYAKTMPITFLSFLVASLAISGVPPLNGFASKWLIYQGIVDTASAGKYLWIVWLLAAMFGSALTLASFMKLVHAVFLGQPSCEAAGSGEKKGEVSWAMWVPQVALALLCILFGIFAYRLPLQKMIIPCLGADIGIFGIWRAGIATFFVFLGILIGAAIYLLGLGAKQRTTEVFVGGEDLKNHPEMRLSGTGFYHTIQDIGILKALYYLAERKIFDVYEMGAKTVFGVHRAVRYLHNGVLPTYLAWCLLGMIALFYFLLK